MRQGSPIRAAIFDLDGTLVDSEPLYAESDAAFLAEYGIVLDEATAASLVGIGTRDSFLLLERLFPDSPLSALPLSERIRLKDLRYLAFAAGKEILFPASAALVAELSARGIPLALASGSSPLVVGTILAELGLAPSFRIVITAMEVARGKPEPDLFLETARRLGVEPASCLVFEDSVPGVLAAAAAGMPCVALPEPRSGRDPGFAGASLVIEGGPAALEVGGLLSRLEALGLGIGDGHRPN
ncbi:MAG TPA: HAD family phosphatase [Rectinemataceae bacterium]|nr:HAD family phosphatase [Rectinemataceae bacterium]